ncbi:hypothetical protein KC19_12G075800 [Ceratodon purpureus]|uniref:Uncharacterized protein n=1 Tax=Ceratodon purpureus TaxID=3225 RepID=A0A8T0G5Q4_CERPU|nr:hypothetical protein KC19_12G075800 [Ceratodon purpureus]
MRGQSVSHNLHVVLLFWCSILCNTFTVPYLWEDAPLASMWLRFCCPVSTVSLKSSKIYSPHNRLDVN